MDLDQFYTRSLSLFLNFLGMINMFLFIYSDAKDDVTGCLVAQPLLPNGVSLPPLVLFATVCGGFLTLKFSVVTEIHPVRFSHSGRYLYTVDAGTEAVPSLSTRLHKGENRYAGLRVQPSRLLPGRLLPGR